MDQKTWLWRKKLPEKPISATNAAESFLENHGAQENQTGKEAEMERCLKDLREQLDSLLCDCNTKDELVVIHAKMAEEAIATREKAEAEILCLKQQLEEALKYEEDTNKRLIHSEAALEECVQKLNLLQEECEQRICDAIMEASTKHEKEQKHLEDRLTKTSKRLGELVVENMHLSNALLMKEKLVEDLHKCQSQAAADLNALMARLDVTEKDNAILKYEFHMLSKEHDICKEELECNRQSAYTFHKQHLEGLKKITELEAECHRLRILQQQRFPGPAALVDSRSEVETRRRKLNMTRDLAQRDIKVKKCSNSSIYFNKIDAKYSDIHQSSVTQSTTKRTVTEARTKEFPGSKRTRELASYSPRSSASSQLSGLDSVNEYVVSSSGSWADALVCELDHLKTEKEKTQQCDKSIVVREMSLMDDFVEMEKLALVSMNLPSLSKDQPDSTGKELIPMLNDCLELSNSKEVICSENVAKADSFDWLQHVLNAMLKESSITKRSMVELLDDIKIALGCMNDLTIGEDDKIVLQKHARGVESLCSGSYISSKSPELNSASVSKNEVSTKDTVELITEDAQSNVWKSVKIIVDLIERINPISSVGQDTAAPLPKSNLNWLFKITKDNDYSVHVFQWKDSEFSAVLRQVACTCRNLLDGKADFEKLVYEVAFAFDWIVNNCINLTDTSIVKDKKKDHFVQNKVNSPDENGNGEDSKASECHLHDENKKLKDDLKNMDFAMKEMEARLEPAHDRNEELMIQLQESEKSIEYLRNRLVDLQESKRVIEDQIENQKLINEDLDTQLTAAKAKLSEVLQKFSTVEVELEDKYNCCEELEATCLDLQLQLECMSINDDPKISLTHDEKQPLHGWEIVPTSVKIPESQESYQVLGKHFKSLAITKEAALFDKFSRTAIISPKTNLTSKHATLRDQLLAEDNVNPEAFTIHNSEEVTGDSDAQKQLLYDNCTSLAIVTSTKKQSKLGPLWKIFMTKNKGSK